MAKRIEIALSDEDSQRIMTHHLGATLSTYGLKAGYIRFVRMYGWILIFIGIVTLISVIIFAFMDWQQLLTLQQNHFYTPNEILHLQEIQEQLDLNLHILLSPFLTGLSFLLVGLVCLRIEIPRALRERIIVCEHGILQVGKRIRNKHVEVIRFSDIRAIRREFFGLECSIQCRDGKALKLNFYQNLDELIADMRQRSGVV